MTGTVVFRRLGVLGLAALPALACAQTAKPDGQWYGSIAAGLSDASGTSRTTSVNIDASGTRMTQQDKLSLYGNYLLTQTKEDDTSTNSADQAKLGGRYEYNVTSLNYVYGAGDLLRNQVQDIQLQSTLGGGTGYKLYKSDEFTFDVFGGADYTRTAYYGNPNVTGWELQFGQSVDYAFTKTTTGQERFVVYPSITNNGDYRATLDASLIASMSDHWGLKVTAGAQYYSNPPLGSRSVSTLFVVGLNYRIGPK